MCSFLLIFLILIVAFDTFHNFAIEWDLAPAPVQAACCGTQSLVLALQRTRCSTFSSSDKDCWHTGQTSLKGLKFDQTYFTSSQQNGRTVALEMQSVLQNQQEDSSQLCDLPWSLDRRRKAQYATQTDLTTCRGQCLGGMVPNLGRSTAELGMGSAFEIGFKGEHTQLSKRSQCQIQCADQTHQRQGQEEVQDIKRRERKRNRKWCSCSDITLCSPCNRNATMADHRCGCECTDATRIFSFLPTGHRRCCPEKRSCASPTCCLSRQCQHARRHQGADRQDGEGHREIGERKLQGYYKKSPFSNESTGKGPKDAHRDVGSQKKSQAQMDKAYCQCSQNMGEPTPRVPTTTGFLPGCGYKSKIRYRTCTECYSISVCQGHFGHPSGNATDHTNQCRNRGKHDRCRSRGRKCSAAAAIHSPELRGVNRCRSCCNRSDRAQPGDSRRQLRPGHKEENAIIRTLRRWGWIGVCAISCTETVIAGGAGLVHSNSQHVASQQAECADAYVTSQWSLSRAACTAQLTNFDHDRFLPWQHSIQTNPKYQNPFDAVHEAWVLGWNVLCDDFDMQMNHIEMISSKFDHPYLIDFNQMHVNPEHASIERIRPVASAKYDDDTSGTVSSSSSRSLNECEQSFENQFHTHQYESKSKKRNCKLSFDP